MYGKKRLRARRRFWRKVGLVEWEEMDEEEAPGECVWYAAAATEGPGDRRDCAAESIGSSETSSESMSIVGMSEYAFVLCARRSGPRGNITKNDRSIMQGRKADASNEVLTLSPMVEVRRTYSPAPTNPAPPVPLPQAARLRGP